MCPNAGGSHLYFGFRVEGVRLRYQGLGLRAGGLGIREGLWIGIQGLGVMVEELGFRGYPVLLYDLGGTTCCRRV
jgi:hypothetical protein